VVRDFVINIHGLSKDVHQFDYHLDDLFFKNFGQEVIQKGSIDAKVTLDKRETFIDTHFELKGSVELICDRSLEPFQYPISINRKIVFKFGEEEKEVSDEIQIISAQRDQLEMGQFMYEFILLEIPMKKLHPKFESESSEDDSIVYSSSTEEETMDPRWEALKKLKK
jgi:uncharacterized metal-binding protein YceD (DUF177 family)